VLNYRTSVASVLIAMSAFAAAATAAECPTLDGEKRLELLDRAPTCDGSMAIFEACSFGATADIGLSEVLNKKCEGAFLAKLNRSQRRKYDREQQRCTRKYQEEGSMYRLFEAFCAANLAKTYAHRLSRSAKP
jgi:hypothetical protein